MQKQIMPTGMHKSTFLKQSYW